MLTTIACSCFCYLIFVAKILYPKYGSQDMHHYIIGPGKIYLYKLMLFSRILIIILTTNNDDVNVNVIVVVVLVLLLFINWTTIHCNTLICIRVERMG